MVAAALELNRLSVGGKREGDGDRIFRLDIRGWAGKKPCNIQSPSEDKVMGKYNSQVYTNSEIWLYKLSY